MKESRSIESGDGLYILGAASHRLFDRLKDETWDDNDHYATRLIILLQDVIRAQSALDEYISFVLERKETK